MRAVGSITISELFDGQAGPQGPAGTPGYIGLSPSGSVLSLKGFNADGSFGASVGYIYIKGVRCTVGQATLTATYTGPGYILANTSTPTSTTVSFARLVPNASGGDAWMEWRDYNSNTLLVTTSAWYVIGTFNVSLSSYLSAEIIQPVELTTFIESRFLQLLGSVENPTDVTLNQWAKAMGVERIFGRIAVLEAFVNDLRAKNLLIGDGTVSTGFLFRAVQDDVGDGSGSPRIDCYYNGLKTFSIDPTTGRLSAISAELTDSIITGTGTFSGMVDHDVLTTRPLNNSGTAVSFPSKTRWVESVLYGALTSVSVGAFTNAAGTAGGKTISKAVRFSSTTQAIQLANISSYGGGFGSYTMDFTGTVELRGQAGTYWEYDEFNNQVQREAAPYITINYNPVSLTYSGGYYWANPNVTKGDVIRVNVTNYKPTTVYCRVTWKPAVTGVVFMYSDGTWQNFKSNGFYSTAVSVTSPNSWASSGNLNFASGSNFVTAMSSYPDGVMLPATGTITHDGTARTVIGVMKFGSEARVYYSPTEYLAYVANSAEGATTGWYNASGSYTPVSATAACLVKNIEPKDDNTYDIGAAGKRFRNIVGSGTISGFNQVYGAVFN